MEPMMFGVLVGTGIFAGVWNAIAGGATLFTFPILLWAGLPPTVANATNFVALIPANAAALAPCKDLLQEAGTRLLPLFLVCCTGAVTGSLLLLVTNQAFFLILIPPLILGATALFTFGDKIRLIMVKEFGTRETSLAPLGALFLASIYGGYFGAGLGIILLAIIQIVGFNGFAMVNAIKNFLAVSFSLVSIAVFSAGDLIAWPEALAMAVGSMGGGYIGGRLTGIADERVLRTCVIFFGCALSVFYGFSVYAG